MVTLRFVAVDEQEMVVEARVGDSIMETAVNAGVPGIVGECGGYGACGTCVSVIDAQLQALAPPMGVNESEMLEFIEKEGDGIRLTCQIRVSEEMDGAVIRPFDSRSR